jgi:TnpA family transposase
MRLLEILPDYEVKRFNRPPLLSSGDHKNLFRLDEVMASLIKNAKEDTNKVGLLVSYGYFKASGKFYPQGAFRWDDIKAAAKTLGVPVPKDFSSKYHDRTRQKHRRMILEKCGYVDSTRAQFFLESIAEDLVANQMHPRKLFYILVETLRHKKIECPGYDKIARVITEKLNTFEKSKLHVIASMVTPSQAEALTQLISTTQNYERPLLIRLKTITQSIRPAHIKNGMHHFLIIKKLFKEIAPLIHHLDLSTEATRYYAQWVIKSKVTQITDMVDLNKRYLYLAAFMSHSYKEWQDTLVDMLLKSVQQQLNKAEKARDLMIKEHQSNKNKLMTSVLSGFHDNQSTLKAVREVVYDTALNNDEKVQKLHGIVPKDISVVSIIQSVTDAEKLQEHLSHEERQGDRFDILATLSRKLQNRVADIVKYLDFEATHESDELYIALRHYQSEKNITSTSPSDFLEDHEYKAIYQNGKANISLYKAILFCKVAGAIKSGKLSLRHSYRYLPIEAYLINQSEWEKSKEIILEKLGLSHFGDIDTLLSMLRDLLHRHYDDVNRRIIQGDNKYVRIKKDGSFYIYTPPVEKPDYEAISTIIGKNRYVPILQMMEEMNALSRFTSHFKHHKIKGTKAKPNHETFYAGIFALGSHISLHKLANTAVGLNYHTLSNTVTWYFSLENLHLVNQSLTGMIAKLWLPNKFKREKNLLHTSSDAQKKNVSVESLNADFSYKYHGHGKGVNVYRFIDERGILFYSTVFSSSERDALYVIDGLLHNESIQSDMHSTDTHGYTEMVFAISHLMGTTFAPRIKDIPSVKLVSFRRVTPKSISKNNGPLQPSYYVREEKIKRNWDIILRLCATIMLRKHRASTIMKRLNSYAQQHPLQEALKEFGRIIKSIFVLKYVDDMVWRQGIEKQLNKGELANKFASAVSIAGQDITEPYPEDQEISAMCKTILQNIIILWNYVELTRIIMRSDKEAQRVLLENLTSASILTWQHVNMHGTYDFSNLVAANNNAYSIDDIIHFKVA